ncbi:MAG TPA: 6-bladed beta-propeller, partial [Gammaproteobacteria bacterium]|nr:6-bladed beta-propeller [Gammaproteobacteria bacterium]
YGQRVEQLSSDGQFIRQWGNTGKIGILAGEFNYPTDVAVADDGTVYVADGYNDRVQVFDEQGQFVRKWGGPFGMDIFGPFNGWFATVTSITLDAQGNILVADFYNNRVQKFTPQGKFLSSFGKKGTGEGQFRKAIAVAVGADGSIFVTDFLNNRVQKWKPKP